MALPRRGRRRGVGQRGPRIGLALAGGGPVAAVYEIAALCALQDALDGVDFSALQIYVGVSSGAFIASMLANGFTPAELREILIETASREHAIGTDVFMSPAVNEFAQRAASLPRLALQTVWRGLRDPLGARNELLAGAGRAIPIGVFDNERLARFLEQAFSGRGRSNDFRRLRAKLRLVATDLDTSDAVAFGAPRHDRVPISRAVQASAALPLLYPPVRIGGRDYVDGALRKTLHASVALREGARLLFCINPIVPFDARLAARRGHPRRGKLADAGLPVVLSQTLRTLIHSRMQVGMASYRTLYKGADVLLFEPRRDDPEMFFTNVFSYSNRHRVFDHAYRATLRDLAARRRELAPRLARHGISIRGPALRAAIAPPRHRTGQPALARLGGALERLERWVAAR
ncbi:MAG TPA: patatin-like phospholipase family protein [Burkholderiales bacterium]|nr:patatin-like phospholipase family protein [Burkholderiales bacterium]